MSLFVGNSILAKKTVAMFCSGSRPDGEELDLPRQAKIPDTNCYMASLPKKETSFLYETKQDSVEGPKGPARPDRVEL